MEHMPGRVWPCLSRVWVLEQLWFFKMYPDATHTTLTVVLVGALPVGTTDRPGCLRSGPSVRPGTEDHVSGRFGASHDETLSHPPG